jgi:hypothetical protein
MKALSLLVVFPSIIVIGSYCQQNGDNRYSKATISDTSAVILSIPHDRNGKVVGYYDDKRKVETKLGLTNLENGFDSIEIRIWYGYAHLDTAQLLILRNNGTEWKGEVSSIIYTYYDEKNDSMNLKMISNSVEPKQGWQKFIKELYGFNILNLPDMNQISNYPSMTESSANIIVQFATKKYYRMYSYADPELGGYSVKECLSVEHILELIRNSFSFKQLREI